MQLAIERLKGAGFVGEGDLLLPQRFDDGAIVASLGAVNFGTRIELNAGQGLQQRFGSAGEDERAGVELDSQGVEHRVIANKNPQESLRSSWGLPLTTHYSPLTDSDPP
jgi:hypothetical protein